jgi:tRNA A-37 threonylcarbamoyl transferase component Bud32
METNNNKLLDEPLVVINVGLSKFAKSMEEQGVEVIQIDWSPPAGVTRNDGLARQAIMR